MKSFGEKITLNVGGVRYETYTGTLQTFPGTKLCRLTEPQACTLFDYDPNTKEFFFDRSAKLFEEVLSYYRTKHLHCPKDICSSVFEEELCFWEISDVPLSFCCWQNLSYSERQQEEHSIWEDSKDGDEQGLLMQMERSSNSRLARWRPKIWNLFENPCSCLSAKFLATICLLFNIGIFIIFCGESFAHSIRDTDHNDTNWWHFHEHPRYHENHNVSHVTRQSSSLLYLELFCVLWFMCEYVVRFICSPNRKKFLRNPLNVVDFLSLFPVYIELFAMGHEDKVRNLSGYLGLVRVLYLLKLLKLFKLVETPLVLRVLPFMVWSILREIFIFMMIFSFEVVFFGALMFYAELLPFYGTDAYIYIYDLFSSFWWAAITLTTVGYGDMVPITRFSQMVASCAAICGVLNIIVPIPVLVIKFKNYYTAAVIKEKMKRHKKTHSPTLPL